MSSRDRPSTLRSGATHDVIVVGAQAAGAATALLLARRSLRVMLLDPRPLGSGAPSTLPLMRAGVLQLSRWGLLDKVIAAHTPAVRRTTFRHGDETVVMSIKPWKGVDALYAPSRSILSSLLLRAAVDAGVDVHPRTSVTNVIRREGRVIGVHATTPDRRLVDLRAPLVIGADGVDSTIARHVAAAFSHVGEHAMATTYAYWPELETDGYEWIFGPHANAGAIPTNNGQAFVFASASPERIGRGGVELIRALVADVAPELAVRLRTTSPLPGARTRDGQRCYIRRSHGPGWALVGAAGHFNDPTSAHGFTDALRDAELLARSVAHGLGDDASLDDALEGYQTTRDRLGLPLFDVVQRIASHRWDRAEIADLLVRLSSAMADETEALAALDPDLV